jgi:peptide/nickel transport system permease protein
MRAEQNAISSPALSDASAPAAADVRDRRSGSPILRLVLRRVGQGLLLLFAVSVLIFAGTQILPGDVAQSILGQSATPQALANLREELGLNQPAYVRYFQWLGGILTGDLGTALSSRQDIATALLPRLGNTLFLAFWAALVSIPLALILGLLAVRHRNGWVDKAISGFALASTSLPEFFIGYLLVFFFAVPQAWMPMPWFPAISTVYEGLPFWARMQAIALPAAALTLVVLAHMMRMTRAAILNVMQSAYIETAELKGLSPFAIIRRHAFPNAIAPIVNVVMLNLAFLVVGVVVIEVIFVYPGMGQYLVDHVSKRDVPVVQAVGLIFAAVYITLNIVADIAAIVANPRLRHPR